MNEFYIILANGKRIKTRGGDSAERIKGVWIGNTFNGIKVVNVEFIPLTAPTYYPI